MTGHGRTRIVILGAGGRDFHVFNTRYRHDPTSEVLAFTAAQIPHIQNRTYPPVLSGALYPDGIRILAEEQLESLFGDEGAELAIFAYSDVSLAEVAEMRLRVQALGGRLETFDPTATQLPVARPSVAVCAVRTGCGKSGVSRHLAAALKGVYADVGVLRHPMPYGHLEKQVVQRFTTVEDLALQECTIEEMEEYEPHIRAGTTVYAGADYLKILGAAESGAQAILWDGGNNDTPFLRTDVLVTLLDPLRAGDELSYFPSVWNLENADILVVAKTDQATPEQVESVRRSARAHNPEAEIILGSSPYVLDAPEAVRGKRVLAVEDGPTTTHGGMAYGAGFLAARAAGAAEFVDPRPFASGEIADAFRKYDHLQNILPALGYGRDQLDDLAATIDRADCDVVVVGTPIDLSRVIRINKPVVRATYGYADAGPERLADAVLRRLGA